jgi:uncharacterized protein
MTQQPTYDFYNPQPLSQVRTNLVWEGKYDEYGQRYPVELAEYTIPIQSIYQRLSTTPEKIVAFCESWQLAELALFGSVLRDDFRSRGENSSDIDILFRYLPNANMSLLRRAKMTLELEHLLGRKVDLLMIIEVIDSHNPIRRKHILDSAQIIYVKR